MQIRNERPRVLFLFCSALFLLLLLSPAVLLAQTDTGSVTGTVTDPSGAVLPNATVTFKNTQTNATRTFKTGPDGAYVARGLPAGTWQITVESGGFQPFVANVEVTVGGNATVDAKMSVQAAAQQIQVVGAGGVTVNTQSQEISQIVGPQQLAQLPSLTRNPYDFVEVAGNVSNGDNTTPSGSQNSTSRGVGFALNGQRESGTEVLLDGVENEDIFGAATGLQIPVDAVQEFRVITNNFDAQYGRASGGVVNLVSKSGTNHLHGSAWEFNRLSAYTANTYNNVTLGLPKGPYTRNQFGYAAGGPVLKNKLFFFQSTEWTRVRSQAVESAVIPTPQMISYMPANVQSYFSAFATTPYPITTTYTQADAGVTIPGVPASTPVFGLVNYRANADAGGDVPQNTYTLDGRLDFNLSANTTMYFRYAQESLNQFSGSAFYSAYPQYDVGYTAYNNTGLYSLNQVFSPNLFSDTKISFSRLNEANTYNTAYQNTPELMISGATVDQQPVQFPGLYNANEPGEGGLPYGGPQNTLQVLEDLSWTKGTHSMRYGGEYTYIQLNKAYGAYAQAVEVLGSNLSQGLSNLSAGNLQYYEAAVDPQGKYPCTANPDGSLNTTAACSVVPPVGSPSFSRSYRYNDWAAYAEDSWKVSPRFTFNYGTRYEHYGVQHNDNPALDSNFYPGAGSSYYQTVRNGSVEIADQSSVGGFWAPSWGTLAPRIGFAMDIFGNGKSSIRGGWGMSYERNFGNVTYNTIQNVPAYAVLQIYGTPVTNSNSGPLSVAGPPVALPPTELRAPDPHIRTAQTQFWSLAFEQQVMRNTVVSVEYNGAHGVHQYDIIASNPLGGAQFYLGDALTFNAACTGSAATGFATACYTRPNSQYAAINTRGSHGSSEYDSMNVRFESQNLHNTGLSITANYTWAHSLDDLSSTFSDNTQGGSGYIGNLGYLNPLDPGLDWGSSDFDVRNRFVASPIWTTPWFNKGKGLRREAIGGYSLVGIFTARTGTPFSAFDYTYNINGYSGIPRLVPATPITSYKAHGGVNVGPNAFNIMTLPAANSYPFDPTLGISDFGPFPGDMTRRNAFRGAGAWNLDAAASKSFALTEKTDLTFRAEGFDVLNHHNLYTNETNLYYDNPPGTANSGPLSVIALKGGLNTIALGGNHDERRFGQFSLRLTF